MEFILDFFNVFPLIVLIIGVCVFRVHLKGAQFRGRESAKGKVAVVTGANCGIGKQIVRDLNYRGAKVYMGCRSLERGQRAISELATAGCSLDRLILHELDLSSLASVRNFAKFVSEKESNGVVDILVNNAGILAYPKFELTEDGHDLTWQTNYLAHFLLTELLLPLMKNAKEPARIVNVSAAAHKSVKDFNLDTFDRKEAWGRCVSYDRSKLAMLLQSAHLTSRLRRDGTAITINCCHPGLCYTRLFRHTPLASTGVFGSILVPLQWFLLKTPKDGAQCVLYCALAAELNGVSGKYFVECKPKDPSDGANDEVLAEQLYQYSRGACGL